MAGGTSPFGHEKSDLVKQLEVAADERIAPNARDVDKSARFPVEAVEVLRELRILSSSLPAELGGKGLRLPQLAEITSVLGRRCGASAVAFAMHESQIETLRFGAVGNPHLEAVLRDYADNQKLVASITSEAGIGGDIHSSQTSAGVGAERIRFEKQAPTVSYAEYADGFLITARRTEDAASSDQVFVYAAKEDLKLEKLGEWDTMGMRGTCSPPFRVEVDVPAENVSEAPFGVLSSYRMEPWSLVLWAAAWEGIATSAYDKATHAVRRKAKKQLAAGDPLGDPHLADAYGSLQALRALIFEYAQVFQAHSDLVGDYSQTDRSPSLAVEAMSLKINASMMASRVAEASLEIIGMPGYSESAPLSVSREVRDLLAARLMVSNDRLRRAGGEILMMGAEV